MFKFLIFIYFSFYCFWAVGQKESETTRILFIFDASKSMFGHFGGKPKIDIAQRLLSETVDSLKNMPNVELALRVYGNRSPITSGNQDCEDTHLEVPFGPENVPQIKTVLKTTYPKGTTPIARSLEATISDFTPCSNCRNVVVLITDGIEACDGDPCAIARAMRKNNIFLKPFVIGLGVLEEYKKHFYCIGNFYDAKDEKSFRTVLGLVLEEALNSTSVQIDLLDVDGESNETNVNMTLYEAHSGKVKYNFYHTMNFKGLPDTLSIDPAVKYNIQVHTLPEVWKENIEITAGQHNTIPIETPQGSIELKLLEGRVRDLKFIVREEGECDVVNVQNFKDRVKYLVGTYDIEVLTLPKIKMVLDVEQSKNSIIQIPAPGLVGFKNPGKGFGSICRKIDGEIDLVYSFLPNSKNKTLELQPGKYVYIFRGQSRQRAFYTVEKDFTIISGKSTVVQF
jgi:Ca-activated chloride channel family protein